VALERKIVGPRNFVKTDMLGAKSNVGWGTGQDRTPGKNVGQFFAIWWGLGKCTLGPSGPPVLHCGGRGGGPRYLGFQVMWHPAGLSGENKKKWETLIGFPRGGGVVFFLLETSWVGWGWGPAPF